MGDELKLPTAADDTKGVQTASALRAVPFAASPAPVAAHPNEGHGRRLTAAFEALEVFPALSESRERVLRALAGAQPSMDDLVVAVGSDLALATMVLRLANRGAARAVSVPEAIGVLAPEVVGDIARGAPTYDLLARAGAWHAVPHRFRLHATAVQRVADRLARALGHPAPDRLLAAALLHDIGKLVLVHAYPGYPDRVHEGATTPEQRLRAERRELGVDHALVGGVLARRWGLPHPLASAIERHHSDDECCDAATIRLADLIAHYDGEGAVAPAQLLRAARAAGLGVDGLRAILYELPYPTDSARERAPTTPSPLSAREVEVLRRLAEGKVYKQIARELGVSTSTVRTHLHNIYPKLGAGDRAQAVLVASARGWL
jgi:putative nucleotidyltransferase with HDIG domain